MVTIYSSGCPRCIILEKKLQQKNIEFQKTDNFSKVIDAGFVSAPVLEVNNKLMDFAEAVKWVNAIEN